MRAISCLIVIFAFFQISTALRCYLCIGSRASDCSTNDDPASKVIMECNAIRSKQMNWIARMTGKDIGEKQEIVPKCIKADFAEDAMYTELYERGCGYIYDDVDLCFYMAAHNPAMLNCESCDTDLCNV